MRELDKPVAGVFRRLRFQRFISSLVWTLAAALFLVAVTLGVARLLNYALPGPDWAPFAIAGGVAVLVAALIAILSGPSRLDAAVAIDHAFRLNERLSTALTLPAELRETPAGRALLADAIRKVADLDMGSQFGTKLPRRAWVVLIPASLAVAMLFVPGWVERTLLAKTETKVDAKALAKQAAGTHQEDLQPAAGDRQGQVPRSREAAGPDREESRGPGQGPPCPERPSCSSR